MVAKGLENSNSRLLLSEILRKVSNAKTKAEKVILLRENNSSALRMLLIWNFDESVISMVPEGDVPYTPNDAPVGTCLLYTSPSPRDRTRSRMPSSA